MTRLHRQFSTLNADLTLATVRELSENATLRPAARVLRCIPARTVIELKPVPAWKRSYLRIMEAFE